MGDRVVLAVRDRPWCRSITLRKDSLNHCGFTIRDGATASIVKDSSAARNGMLINHRVIEINGQNMVGLKDKEIVSFIQASPPSVTVTVMPLHLHAPRQEDWLLPHQEVHGSRRPRALSDPFVLTHLSPSPSPLLPFSS